MPCPDLQYNIPWLGALDAKFEAYLAAERRNSKVRNAARKIALMTFWLDLYCVHIQGHTKHITVPVARGISKVISLTALLPVDAVQHRFCLSVELVQSRNALQEARLVESA